MPSVALVTKPKLWGNRRLVATPNLATFSHISHRRPSNWIGWASIFARHLCCSLSTGIGHAPNEPWLRKATSSFSSQYWRRSGARGLGGSIFDESGTSRNLAGRGPIFHFMAISPSPWGLLLVASKGDLLLER